MQSNPGPTADRGGGVPAGATQRGTRCPDVTSAGAPEDAGFLQSCPPTQQVPQGQLASSPTPSKPKPTNQEKNIT